MGTLLAARRLLLGAAMLGYLAAGSPAPAAPDRKLAFDLPEQDLGDALRRVARTSGREIMFSSDLVEGRRSPALKGSFAPDDAARRLIAGSGLTLDIREDVVFVRGRAQPSSAQGASSDEQIVVTGSRLRGAPSASPTLQLSGAEMIAAGRTSLGDVIRDIPQNFSGGQNPGIGFDVPTSSGENIGAGTAINLRGLGQDATLTLLNGHRLTYGGYRQSVDVSSIPVETIDRVEIVIDGASALYGSDAVAGVANIILERDFEGLSTSATFGGSTDGGYSNQHVAVVGGGRWQGGGVMLAGKFDRNSAIEAEQRAYARPLNPGLTLYPFIKRHSLLASGHQTLGRDLTLELDALYDKHRDFRSYSISGVAGSPYYEIASSAWSLSLAPAVRWQASRTWEVVVSAVYGIDRAHYGTDLFTSGIGARTLRGCYCNQSRGLEASASGDLVALPGGTAKLALGAGLRRNDFHAFRTTGAPQDIDVAQDARYAFAEIGLPLVGPASNVPLIRRLFLSAALRYEDYRGVDRVVTPKLGLVYAPSPDIEVKGSWGKSFKAPTLFQRYSDQLVTWSTAASRGGSGFPPGSTVLMLSGGQPALRAERATTWSATLALHPRAVPGLTLEIGGFDIRYRDRVSTPIALLPQALSNPAYADLVDLAPSLSDIAAALAGRGFRTTLTGMFDPARVVAIIDNRAVNLAAQHVRGIDASARYAREVTAGGTVSADVAISYLDSEQKLNPTEAYRALSGTYFNPPHWRARGGVGWTEPRFGLRAAVNHLGGGDDNRFVPASRIGTMTTVDLSGRFTPAASGWFGDVDISVSLFNLFDTAPPRARSTFVFEPPYDSTNASPLGRVVSIGISKRW